MLTKLNLVMGLFNLVVMKVIKKRSNGYLFFLKFFLVGLIVYIFCSLFLQTEKINKKKEVLSNITDKVRSQDVKNKELMLMSEITDASAEKEAKLKLEFSKKGERVFVVSEG